MQSLVHLVGTQKKSLLDFFSGFFSNAPVLHKMLRILNFFWALVLSCSGYVFRLVLGVILSYRKHAIVANNKSESSFDRRGNIGEIDKGSQESDDSFASGSALAASTSKYQVVSGKDVVKFVEEPQNVCFSVQEFYVGSHDFGCFSTQFSDKSFSADNSSLECLLEDENVCCNSTENILGKEGKIVKEDEIYESRDVIGSEEDRTYADSECSCHSELGPTELDDGNLRTDHEVDFVSLDSLLDKNVVEGLGLDIDKTEAGIDREDEEETEPVSTLETFCTGGGNDLDSEEVKSKDFDEELLMLGSISQHSDGSDILKLSMDITCKADLVGEEREDVATTSRTMLAFTGDETDHSNDEHEKLRSNLQIPEESNAENLLESGNFQSAFLIQESEDTETLDDKYLDDVDAEHDYLTKNNNSNEEHKKLGSNLQNPEEYSAENLSENDNYQANLFGQESDDTEALDRNEELSFQDRSPAADDDDYLDDMDMEDDHLFLEQYKSEIRRMRNGGLPTIFEESESPKMEDYLSPLKIEQKFDYKYQMNEIQKVCKSYAERMRKLDILNFQTLNAIGLQQMKDPKFFISSNKFSAPSVKSFMPSNLWPHRARRIAVDPSLKYFEDLQKGLEMVYVGQVCLSWEILRWQYWKAQELQEHDTLGFRFRKYNLVAGDFQLFQVLVERFLEDEPYQGPRVQNYVKTRCNLRSLLQIPAIRDDCLKDKKYGKGGDSGDAISCSKLSEIIEESMRVFWEFLRADRDASLQGLISKGLEHQDPADSELLVSIRSEVQKKEKKLHDILRSGNCIVKRFQKRKDDHLHLTLLFAQVELKVVSRVVNMSSLTRNQLQWCQEKLDNIVFSSRKVHLEPAFLLFPC